MTSSHAPYRHSVAEYAERIRGADVSDVAVRTPLDAAGRLSRRLGNAIRLKREDLQPVFSFKIRGAYNRIARLSAAEVGGGVICSSAGNHAQGVALAARRRGVRAVIVMPESTPSIKVDAVRALGGETVLVGMTFDEAYAHALHLADSEQLEFIHPFADPDVIAGQGTIGREIAEQWPAPPDAVFVPVGGGGLISGVGAWLKQHHPGTRVIGVEPVDAAGMHAALMAGSPVTLEQVGIFADGVAVRRVADETFRIASEVVDDIILVDTDQICAAIKDIFEDSRIIAEPAGALSVAGLKRYIADSGATDRSFVAINSGANMNFDRLRHVVERAEIGEHREALIAVEIPERRGAFLEFCEALGRRNITEFNYRYFPAERAQIFAGITLTRGIEEAEEIVASLEGHGYRVLNLSGNELAKLHVRHMVGGHVPSLEDEIIYRFEFPERPGALLRFLEAVGVEWNITLFHYRNHGSDYGRVLAGIQVREDDRARFKQHIDRLGYHYVPETDNPVYRLFLGS